MNKVLPILLLCMVQGYAQIGSANRVASNELKLNTLYLPGGYAEFSYERILGNKSAVGISMGFLFGSSGPNYATDILTFNKAILPYYRYHFGKKRASGFFVEGNTILYSDTAEFIDEKETGWGMGLGFGIKLPMKNNWNVEFLAGGGFGINSRDDNSTFLNFPYMYPRLGLSIGKRF